MIKPNFDLYFFDYVQTLRIFAILAEAGLPHSLITKDFNDKAPNSQYAMAANKVITENPELSDDEIFLATFKQFNFPLSEAMPGIISISMQMAASPWTYFKEIANFSESFIFNPQIKSTISPSEFQQLSTLAAYLNTISMCIKAGSNLEQAIEFADKTYPQIQVKRKSPENSGDFEKFDSLVNLGFDLLSEYGANIPEYFDLTATSIRKYLVTSQP